MNKYFYLFFCVFISFLCCNIDNDNKFVFPEFEIDPEILVSSTDVIFSGTEKGNRFLYRYSISGRSNLGNKFLNYQKPFLYEDSIVALKDSYGDNRYVTSSIKLNLLLKGEKVRKIFVLDSADIIVFQSADNNNLYLLKKFPERLWLISSNTNSLHSVCTSSDGALVINYDNKLVLVESNADKFRIQTLVENSNGENMTPSIFNSYVYYSNNKETEFYQIFRINLRASNPIPELYHKANNDLRLPKQTKQGLYYLEVVHSEYLLRRLDNESKRVRQLTTKGVIYNYDFFNESIVMVYTDIDTPRSLLILDIKSKKFYGLKKTKLNVDFSWNLLKPKDRSPAYRSEHTKRSIAKGIIIFLHPGLHLDFSPRWDSVLSNLMQLGYSVYSPNYPMSLGHGKTFRNKTIMDAVEDILKWERYISTKYPHLPLYYIVASSSNILLDEILLSEDSAANGAVSMFGLALLPIKTSRIPVLYILGEKDPQVNFKKRLSEISEARQENQLVSYVSFRDEGHWLHNEPNISYAIGAIDSFFKKRKKSGIDY